MDKRTARELVRKKKKQMTIEEVEEKSSLILSRLQKEAAFLEAEVLYCYVSYNQEVRTKPLIEAALRAGKRVAVPKVIGKEMEFIYLSSLEELGIGYQGIEEPTGTQVATEEKVLMIMPGLAFDKEGNRVGYGGGFYDCYLDKNQDKDFFKLALAFDFQVVDQLIVEACDEPVDAVLTECQYFQL